MKAALCFVILLCSMAASAQPWVPQGAGRVKLADVVATYKQTHPTTAAKKDDAKEEDDEDGYQFQRWEWWARQHCDADGYIVSPVKNLEEWQKYTGQYTGKSTSAAKTTGNASNWLFQGPHQTVAGSPSGMGRVNVVAFDPVDSNTFYAGSASGGAWKTTTGGASWVPLYDNWPTPGVADIKINPKNRKTIYIATGDVDAATAYSSGIIKSTDGGATWNTTGLNWTATSYLSARSIYINPLDTNKITVATNTGIFKSFDGGAHFSNIYPGADFREMTANPADTNILYGCVVAYPTIQIMRSVNGGYSWDTVTHFPNAQRICLAVCPSVPGVVRVIEYDYSTTINSIYGSNDSGKTFKPILIDATCKSGCTGQSYYDLCIAINPTDTSKITLGGLNTYHSVNGGRNWQQITQGDYFSTTIPVVHSDKHYMAYNPLTGALFQANDGGLFKTYAPLTGPWTDLSNGLDIAQVYRCAVDNGADFCILGTQDNCNKMLNTGVLRQLQDGFDGMQCRINHGNPHRMWYVSHQLGTFYITRDSGATYKYFSPGNGYWITPLVLHPTDTATLYVATFSVYVSHNNGVTFTPISPVFDPSYTFTDLAVANTNTNYMFATENSATQAGSIIRYTINGGTTWDTLHNPTGMDVSRMAIEPNDEKTIWFSFAGYSAHKVYKYELTGNKWTNYSYNLPNVPVNCILIDTSSDARYIGTDVGVFYQKATDTVWTLYNNSLPTVSVQDLNINYKTYDIWAATFGRGMWKSIKADTPFVPVVSVPHTLKLDALNIFPDPNNGVFSIYTSYAPLIGEQVDVLLYNAEGRTVFSKKMRFDTTGKLVVNALDLGPGTYICEVHNPQVQTKSKLVIY